MKQAAPPAWSMPTQPKGQVVSSFKVTKKLPPGTPGAQKLLQRFGEALVCVRHRVTPDGEARCTTVELVLEQVPIRSRTDQLVGVQVGYGEKALQSQVKAAGGVWDPSFRLWKLPQRPARRLGLSDRVRALQERYRCGIHIYPEKLHPYRFGWIQFWVLWFKSKFGLPSGT